MRYPLSASHFAALYGPDLILLDARVGRYDLLAGAAEGVEIGAEGASLVIGDPDLAVELAALGIVVPLGPVIWRAPPPPHPTDTIDLGAALKPSAGDAWRMTGGWIDMLANYYGRPFHHLLSAAKARPAVLKADGALLEPMALAFDRLSPWVPFQGDCLFRCFRLRRLLRRSGLDAVWVFGVRSWPFQAHCWLQADGVALTDHAERLISFSPIMAL